MRVKRLLPSLMPEMLLTLVIAASSVLHFRHTLVQKLSKINVAKYLRKIPSLAEVGAQQSYS